MKPLLNTAETHRLETLKLKGLQRLSDFELGEYQKLQQKVLECLKMIMKG